jgi:hypothetical protein
MKPDALPELFEALVGDSERDCAPSLSNVLAVARRERRRRMRVRGFAIAASVLAIWLALPRERENQQVSMPMARESVAPYVAPAGKPLSIERISDDQLLDFLGSTPAALVQMPDGRQQLMVVAGLRRR